MGAAAILSDLAAAGVTIAARGDRLRFHPRAAVGSELLARLREHKADLLAILQPPAAPVPTPDAAAVWTAALGVLADDFDFPADLLEVLRSTSAQWADPAGGEALEGHDVQPETQGTDADTPVGGPRWDDCEPPGDPCASCGGLVMWWTATGRPRCLSCDPPTTARRLADLAAGLRRVAVPAARAADGVFPPAGRCWRGCGRPAVRSITGRRYCFLCGLEPRRERRVPFTPAPRVRTESCQHVAVETWIHRDDKAFCGYGPMKGHGGKNGRTKQNTG